MKKIFISIFLFFALTTIVLANPSPMPHRVAGTIVVIGSAFFVEIAITTGYLVLVGFRAGPLFVALLVINLATYYLILVPGVFAGISLLAMEVVVILLEASMIKGLSRIVFFQSETFTVFKWRDALIASTLGNAFSYGVGEMLRR